MRRTFYHGVSQSLFLLMINDRKSTPCYSVSSVVGFDDPPLSKDRVLFTEKLRNGQKLNGQHIRVHRHFE